MNNLFDWAVWEQVPFHFWTAAFFVFGAMVGSFLNVCIYRMPRNMSVIAPSSRCLHCERRIPWRYNLPLVAWLFLRGKCAFCGHWISVRYFAVEALAGGGFLACWLFFGPAMGLAVIYGFVLAGLIMATFIDVEHFIIPDEITLGGVVAGFFCSFMVPEIHGTEVRAEAMEASFWGIAFGGGVVYVIVRVGKLLFGRRRIELGEDSTIVFGEESLFLPQQEIRYGEIFYRRSDTVVVLAKKAELIDRCFLNAEVRLSQHSLKIGGEMFRPEAVSYLEVVADRIVIPREAMGLGDVKFMAAIGAFLGWQAVLFSLMLSSIVGAAVGVGLIAIGRRDWSSRLPYGPYIALVAAIWIFLPDELRDGWEDRVESFFRIFVSRRGAEFDF